MSSLAFSEVAPNSAGCFTTIDPHYAIHGSPARMADGRIMTDYRPRCLHYSVSAAQAFGDNEYRNRMVHGAQELMTAARAMNNRKNTSVNCVDTMVPELYKRVCTWKGCKTIPGNFQGIGTGRIYIPSTENAASNPQALSDTMPTIPQTYARDAPSTGSQCATNDPETTWSLKGPAAMNGSAKSHPYSAPRA